MKLTEPVGRALGLARACALTACAIGGGMLAAGQLLGLVALGGGLLLWWGSS